MKEAHLFMMIGLATMVLQVARFVCWIGFFYLMYLMATGRVL